MRYPALVAASAALLVPALASNPNACSKICGKDEQIQVECHASPSNVAACMCTRLNFFTAWKDCRACLLKEKQLTEKAYTKVVEAIDSVSSTLCAPSAASTLNFQSLWEDAAGRLGVDQGDSSASPVGAAHGTTAGPPRASTTAVASVSAGLGSSGDSKSGKSASAVSTSAAIASTRVSTGSASPSNTASASRSGSSTSPKPSSPINGNAAHAGKIISNLAVAAAGAAVVLAL